MIEYKITQSTYFNTIEEFNSYINTMKVSGNMKADVCMGLEINGFAQEKLSVSNMPSNVVHTVSEESRLKIGV